MASSAPLDDTAFAPHAATDRDDGAVLLGQARSVFDFRYIAAAVRANLLLIAAIILSAVAIAVIATMMQTPRYTARATVQISGSVDRVLKDQQASEGDDVGGFDFDRNLKTQIEVLKSRALARRIVQKLNLAGNAAFFASQEMPAPPAGVPSEATLAIATGVLQGHLEVAPPRDSRVVTISWDSIDPRMSALIANAYANEFIQANLQRKFDSSSYARNFVAEQLAETKQKVEDSERALNDYARQNALIRTRDATMSGGDANDRGTGGQSVTTANLLQLNSALNEATTRRIIAEGRWQAMVGKPLLSMPEVLSNGTVQQLLAQRAEAETALQQDRMRHLDDYPSVQQNQARGASINKQLQQIATTARDAVRADYQAAVETENRLSAQVKMLKGETLSEQDRTVRYSLLAREADTNRQLYDGLLQRYKELNASAGIALSNISIVDEAEVPGGPSSPNLMKNLVVALLLGIGLSAITVFIKDQFDDSIRVPEDVEAKLSLPLLGVVPKAHGEGPEEAMIDPKSPLSEAYNSLRGSLLYSSHEGLPQIILMTSAQPAEGKSTSSFAVAASLARMNKKVLLIDADLRRPSLHRHIGYGNEQGLSTLLTSQDPLASVLRPSGQDNLTFMTSGVIPPSPTELLSSGRLEQVLQEAAREFEVVIIDSPPILGLADSPTIAALVDGVVFVVEADRSRRGALKTALRRLRAMRPVMLGAVLTKFDPLKAGNRYSEYYGYSYYQYGDRKDAA